MITYLSSQQFFFGAVAAILILEVYVLFAFRRWMRRDVTARWRRRVRISFWVLFGIINILLGVRVYLRAMYMYPSMPVQQLISWSFLALFAVVLVFALFLFFHDAAHRLQRYERIRRLNLYGADPEDPGRRKFFRTGAAAAAATIITVPSAAAIAASHDYVVRNIPLSFPRFPVALDGLRIVQISDLHSGLFMNEAEMRDIAALVNDQRPDMIMITGDLVDNHEMQLRPLINAFKNLKAELGIYGCYGNHEHYAGIGAIEKGLRPLPMRVLINEHVTRIIDGAWLNIAGVDDMGLGPRFFCDFPKAIKGMPKETFTILLSHRPDIFKDAQAEGIDLTLVGHTHGGQVSLNVAGLEINPITLVHPYVKGLFSERGRLMYVNSGLGMVTIPVRTVPPEIAVFDLRRGPLTKV